MPALPLQRHDRLEQDQKVLRIQHFEVPARRGLGGRAFLDRKVMQAHAVGADRPAGFGLPPVIDDRNLEVLFGPLDGIRVGAFPGQEKNLETGNVVLLDQLTLGIVAFDGPKRRGGRE